MLETVTVSKDDSVVNLSENLDKGKEDSDEKVNDSMEKINNEDSIEKDKENINLVRDDEQKNNTNEGETVSQLSDNNAEVIRESLHNNVDKNSRPSKVNKKRRKETSNDKNVTKKKEENFH